jgi:hypothetical protein
LILFVGEEYVGEENCDLPLFVGEELVGDESGDLILLVGEEYVGDESGDLILFVGDDREGDESGDLILLVGDDREFRNLATLLPRLFSGDEGNEEDAILFSGNTLLSSVGASTSTFMLTSPLFVGTIMESLRSEIP